LRASLGILFFALAGLLIGCASQPEVAPAVPPPDAGLSRQVRSIEKRQDQFGGQAETLLKDIGAFRGQSGWNELAPILKSTRMAPGGKGSQDAAKSPPDLLQAWGNKWGQSPTAVSQRYQQLVERSAAIEKERKALAEAWSEIQTRERERIRSSAEISAKNTEAFVANASLTYEMNRANLNRFGLDELGLFAQMVR
jgi:hypothetical protein